MDSARRPYIVQFESRVVKDLGKLEQSDRQAVKDALDKLSVNGTDGDVKRISGLKIKPPLYRLRVGRLRVFLAISRKNRAIRVMDIRLRQESADTYDIKEMKRMAKQIPQEFDN